MTVTDKFLRYIQIETTSSETTHTTPSTSGQWSLATLLKDELLSMGASNVRLDSFGYVYATVPGKGPQAETSIGLIAHMDTSNAVPGPTRPQIIRNYAGGPITLRNGIKIDGFAFLDRLKGEDLIVTDGTSVLGADDKAGVAEIMALAQRLLASDAPDHCTVHIAFTPDEEIGEGADHFDLEHFPASWAYTVDGGSLGELEYECFNAASCKVTVKGINIHPGAGKNQMKNASLIAMEFNSMLPPAETPAHTENYEGFYHLCGMKGDEELAELVYILRDHDLAKLEARKSMTQRIAEFLNGKYGEDTVEVALKDSYRNMKQIVEQHPEILQKAKEAFEACGIQPVVKPIRGGTDGARLSYMGLPCPNLSTGGYNYHGRKELIPVSSLDKMTDVLVEITKRA